MAQSARELCPRLAVGREAKRRRWKNLQKNLLDRSFSVVRQDRFSGVLLFSECCPSVLGAFKVARSETSYPKGGGLDHRETRARWSWLPPRRNPQAGADVPGRYPRPIDPTK